MENARNKPFMLILIAALVALLAWVLNMKNVPAGLISRTRLAAVEPELLEIKPKRSVPEDGGLADPELEARVLDAFDASRHEPRTNAPLLISFTQKTACRANAYFINRAVERWYVMEGEWPSPDLNDRFSRDKDYFPNGIPRCPVNGERYRLDPQTHRVMGHTHDEIPDVTDPSDFIRR